MSNLFRMLAVRGSELRCSRPLPLRFWQACLTSSHPGTAPHVTIVTVLFNSAGVLDRFLSSLVEQSMPNWELIAVDNASIDGSADRVAALRDERIHVVSNSVNAGFARASNRGLRLALERNAAFCLLLNNDTAFPRDFLADLLEARDSLSADVITPRIMYLNAPEKAWYAGGFFDSRWVFKSVHEEQWSPEDKAPRLVEFASGCCLGLTRRVLEQAGFLDERYFVYWEDTDYCLTLRKLNLPIHYAPTCIIWHDSSKLTGGPNSAGFIRLFYRGYMQFLLKHFGLRYTARAMARLLLRNLRHRDDKGRLASPSMCIAMVGGVLQAIRHRSSRLTGAALR